MKSLFWRIANYYGFVLGFPALALFHRALLNLSLHGLGYDNMYCTGEEGFLKRLAGKDIQVVFDIGANVGSYSRTLKKYIDAEVYAFEPASDSFRELCKVEGIRPVNAALSDAQGTAVLHTTGACSGSASLDEHAKGARETVQVTTIDAFVQSNKIPRLDFVKIDVEGFEREVLRGAVHTIATLRPRYIQFEFNILQLKRGYNVWDIAGLLPGYDLYRLLPHGMLKADPAKFADNIFIFSNYVAAARPER